MVRGRQGQRTEVTGTVDLVRADWRKRGTVAGVQRFMRVSIRSDDGDFYSMMTRAAWAFDAKPGERITLTGRPSMRSRQPDGTWQIMLKRPLRKEGS